MRVNKLLILSLTIILASCGPNSSSSDSTNLSDPSNSDSGLTSSTNSTTNTSSGTSKSGTQTSSSSQGTSRPAFQVTFVTNATTTLPPLTTSYIEFPPSVTNDPLVLEGWYLNASFTQVVIFPYQVTAPVTFYAKWIEGTPGFNFRINAGSTGYIVESYAGNANQVLIPASHQGLPVVEIGAYVFYENGSITNVTLPSTIQTIGLAAFKNATGISSFTIPNSVTHLDTDAFAGTTNLAAVNFSTNLQVIGNNAFEGSKLSTITLPASLLEINARAFANNSLLQTVNLNGTTPPLRFPSSFENCHANLRFKVPSAALNTYKQSTYWSAYSSIIISQ